MDLSHQAPKQLATNIDRDSLPKACELLDEPTGVGGIEQASKFGFEPRCERRCLSRGRHRNHQRTAACHGKMDEGAVKWLVDGAKWQAKRYSFGCHSPCQSFVAVHQYRQRRSLQVSSLIVALDERDVFQLSESQKVACPVGRDDMYRGPSL
jgi:hypothetical protein